MTDYVVANVNGGYDCIYCFCKPEEAPAMIEKAQKEAAESARRFAEIGGEYFTKCAESERRAKYELMTFDEFLSRQRAAIMDEPVEETTAEKYEDALCVLPPLHYVTINGVTMFCMGEMLTGTYARQYAKIGNRFYTAIVDTKDKSTWLHSRLS